MTNKVLIIGLDGATWDIIDPLISQGHLPNLSSMIDGGTRATLDTIHIPASNAAWTSFATGCNPDRHGIMDFTFRKKDSYDTAPYTSRDRKRDTLWEILGRKGKKVGILNVPGTYPVDKVNGFMISGFPTPEEMEDFTYPRALLEELRKELGRDFRFQPRIPIQEEASFLKELYTIADFVNQATIYLMNHREWDLLVSVFMASDEVCHAFWRYIDPEHPQYDSGASKLHKNAIFDTYKHLDTKIGTLRKEVDSDTSLIIMSDHGFGPLYYGVSFNNWLMKEGLLALRKTPATKMRYWFFRRGVNYYNVLRISKRLKLMKLVDSQVSSTRSRLSDFANRFFITNNDIDWNNTRAYCMGSMGQIFINLKDREPQGTVEPNGEYHALVNEIKSKIQKLKDPVTKEIIFDKVYTNTEAYPQSTSESNTPDIIFYDSDMKYQINRYFLFGSKELLSPFPVWSGTHKHNGIFLAVDGDNVFKGISIHAISICDIAPTTLHMLGMEVPEDINGHVLTNMFKKDSEPYNRKIRYERLALAPEDDLVKLTIGKLKKRGKL